MMPKKDSSKPSTQIVNAIVCEDIRHEINNKVSLIGIFSDDILVAAFPAGIRISFFVQFFIPISGSHHRFEVFFKFNDQKQFGVEGEIVSEVGQSAIFASPQLMIAAPNEGDLEIEISIDDVISKTIKKHVSTGTVMMPGFVPPPSEASAT